jgi:hypothetical protein
VCVRVLLGGGVEGRDAASGGVLIGVSSTMFSGEAANHGSPASATQPAEKLQPSPARERDIDAAADMHKLSRTSLAAVVCPSAPFLAPRLLRTVVPIAARNIRSAPSAGLQKSCYATKSKGKKPEHKFLTRQDRRDRERAAQDEVCHVS